MTQITQKIISSCRYGDAFNILILKNFEINIYLPINGCKNFNNWIFDLKKVSENLYIHETLPIDELIKQISVYDYGINFYILNKKETKVSDFTFNGGMGTKYFTLLEGGLPIIVNSGMKYINELVKKNKIGISLNSKRFSSNRSIYKKINYPELKKNVKKFKLKNNLFVKSDELVSFYSSYKLNILQIGFIRILLSFYNKCILVFLKFTLTL